MPTATNNDYNDFGDDDNFFFFYSFLLSNKHGYKQYTEQLCCIKQYLIVVYDISTAPTITVKSLI